MNFLVTGRDEESRTIEIQFFDRDVDEIEEEACAKEAWEDPAELDESTLQVQETSTEYLTVDNAARDLITASAVNKRSKK